MKSSGMYRRIASVTALLAALLPVLLLSPQPATAQTRGDASCIAGDTLDPLPSWDYCEIVDSLRAEFSRGLPDSRNLYASDTEDVEIPDSMSLRTVRVLAWGTHLRDRSHDNRRDHWENKPLQTYLNRILLWVEFVRGQQARPGVAIVAMEWDSLSVSPSWRIGIRPQLHDDPQYFEYLPYSTHFFDMEHDSIQIVDTASRYLGYVTGIEPVRYRLGTVETFQDGYIRRMTWKGVLGREPVQSGVQ